MFLNVFSLFRFGLAQAPAEQQQLDIANGNFNTPVVRLSALVAVAVLQAALMWQFITFQLRRMREGDDGVSSSSRGDAGSPASSTRGKKSQQEKAKARKEKRKEASGGGDDNDLTEVDQNTKKTLRQRK